MGFLNWDAYLISVTLTDIGITLSASILEAGTTDSGEICTAENVEISLLKGKFFMKNQIDFYEKDSIEILFASSDHTFPLHSHACFCFGIVEEGCVTFSINGNQKLLGPGMAYIIPSNTGVAIQAEGNYHYITVCIKNKWKERLKHLEFSNYFLPFLSSSEIHKMCMDYIKSGSAEAFVQSIVSLMQPVMLKDLAKCDRKETSGVVEVAGQYIDRHAQEKFSLDALAEAVHISKYYLVRLFKEEMGVTPNQYYNQAKLRMAKEKIMSTKKEVDVAMELNFNDQSHLCNLFKRQMGISLQNYKKSFKEL